MTSARVTSFVASTYVRQFERSRAFYEALGFSEQRVGRNDVSAWSYLRFEGYYVLVVASDPPMDVPVVPLLFYFFVDDLGQASASLESAGHPVEHLGFPPHALGGEARVLDPDGNTILLGQAEPSSESATPPAGSKEHFSLLRETTALAKHRMAAGRPCEVTTSRGQCGEAAEIKLADTWGDTLWACMPHAERALLNAPTAFIANEDTDGLSTFREQQRLL